MKIGINIAGLSHNNLGNGMHSYKDAYENLFKNVINPLKEIHEVFIYLYTYNTEENDNLLDIYKPTDVTFIDLPQAGNKNDAGLAARTYINSLEKLVNEELDFIITTRFDLDINTSIDFDFQKFNFLFKELNNWNNHQLTTDTFYAFPHKIIGNVIKSLNETWDNKNGLFCPGLFHGLYPYLKNNIDENNISFIDETHSTVQISDNFRLGKFKNR